MAPAEVVPGAGGAFERPGSTVLEDIASAVGSVGFGYRASVMTLEAAAGKHHAPQAAMSSRRRSNSSPRLYAASALSLIR